MFIVNVPVGLASLIAGWHMLREVRHPDAARPDFLGAGLLTAAMAALVVAIVQGATWGWASARILGLFALAALLIALVGRRIAHSPLPDRRAGPAESRDVQPRDDGLTAVLRGVRRDAARERAVPDRDLARADPHRRPRDLPRPRDGRRDRGSRRAAGRALRPGRVGAVGALLFALGGVWWVTRLTGAPHYAADFLPGMMIGGLGVGLMIPSLTGAVASTLAPARLATGIAVQTTGRQIGSALGFAILVAVLGTPHTAGDFKAAWELHDRREPARRGDARRDRRARAGAGERPIQPERSGAGEARNLGLTRRTTRRTIIYSTYSSLTATEFLYTMRTAWHRS